MADPLLRAGDEGSQDEVQHGVVDELPMKEPATVRCT